MDTHYIKAAAHKIEMHAESIKLRMQAIQHGSLENEEPNVIGVNFQDVLYYCEAMQRVVNEVLPGLLPSHAAPECEVCKKPEGPFIRVEVSEDGERYQWVNACSDACLRQITLRWKQTAEIIYPGK